MNSHGKFYDLMSTDINFSCTSASGKPHIMMMNVDSEGWILSTGTKRISDSEAVLLETNNIEFTDEAILYIKKLRREHNLYKLI